MEIKYLVERFLREVDMPPTKFGRLAVRDPRLVLDMRNGREIGQPLAGRVRAFIINYRIQQAQKDRTPG